MMTFAEALLVKELELPPIKLVVPARLLMVPLLVTAALLRVALERSISLVASTVTVPPLIVVGSIRRRPPPIDRIVPPAFATVAPWIVSFPPLASMIPALVTAPPG